MRRIENERRVREMSDTTLAISASINGDAYRQMQQFHDKLLK